MEITTWRDIDIDMKVKLKKQKAITAPAAFTLKPVFISYSHSLEFSITFQFHASWKMEPKIPPNLSNSKVKLYFITKLSVQETKQEWKKDFVYLYQRNCSKFQEGRRAVCKAAHHYTATTTTTLSIFDTLSCTQQKITKHQISFYLNYRHHPVVHNMYILSLNTSSILPYFTKIQFWLCSLNILINTYILDKLSSMYKDDKFKHVLQTQFLLTPTTSISTS